jgi:glycosyltransferase involved in cell wall biosynthesis
MMEWIDITFRKNRSYNSHPEFLERYYNISYKHYEVLAAHYKISVHNNACFDLLVASDSIQWHYTNLDNPLKVAQLRRAEPVVYFIHGFTSPLQVMMLKAVASTGSVFIVRHHAEKPSVNIFKQCFQRLAFRKFGAYVFVSRDQAQIYKDKGIIASGMLIEEIMECSTIFSNSGKKLARVNLGIKEGLVFLWVGRLNGNKDPMTVLRGFSRLAGTGRPFILYMFYSENELEEAVRKFIQGDPHLAGKVLLKGKIKHDELVLWYSAADFYVSGSHDEGSGVALCEAMACGCIPVVTDIPSFRRMTKNGSAGRLYPAGDSEALFDVLWNFCGDVTEEPVNTAMETFRSDLSFSAIAAKYLELTKRLSGR